MRRPPISTLFPYPPLSRSARIRQPVERAAAHGGQGDQRPEPENSSRQRQPRPTAARDEREPSLTVAPQAARSEEHTSELQSRQYLVCRLLLEKKKHRHLPQ